jgi:REP element-mobilizing transposase RayT
MPRRPRIDYPGAIHHIYNRGTARRPVLETVADLRGFQALVARAVRAGLIEVHAFSLLTTHYHLLAGSPAGRISEAMRRIGNGYVRRFNRERRRDGSLMRGRFGSRLVESSTHFRMVVRYIDLNPVDARLAEAAHLYPHGSAWHYARARRPPWLRTDAVEALVCDAVSAQTFDPRQYVELAEFDADVVRTIVEARISAPSSPDDPLDDLVRAAPIEVQRWMAHKAGLADATSPGVVLLRPRSVVATIDELAIAEHARSLRNDPAYAALAADVVHRVIRQDFGPPRRLFDLPRRVADARLRIDDPQRGFVALSSRDCGKRWGGV